VICEAVTAQPSKIGVSMMGRHFAQTVIEEVTFGPDLDGQMLAIRSASTSGGWRAPSYFGSDRGLG
jgi:hypothetical protein